MRQAIARDLTAAREALERVAAAWEKQPPEHLPDIGYSVKEISKQVDAICGDYEKKPALLSACKALARKSNALAFMGERFQCMLSFVPSKRFNLDRFKVDHSALYQQYTEEATQERLSFKARP